MSSMTPGPTASPGTQDNDPAQSVAGEEDPGASIDMPAGAASPGTPGTGEDLCPDCAGTGKQGSSDCPTCQGTGRVIVGIGGA